MTDAEFTDFWVQEYCAPWLVYQLGKMVASVELKNGKSYVITCVDDLRAVVEQELYEKMTGRE